MRTVIRGIAATSIVVIGLSIVGFTELAGALGALALLVTVLATALQPARPKSRGRRPAVARTPSFLARYRPVAEAESVAGIVLASFAVWDVLEFFGFRHVGALSLGLLLPLVTYVVAPNAAALLIGVCGSISVTASLILDHAQCEATASAAAAAVYLAVLATAVVVVVAVRSGWMGLRRPLRNRIGRGAWALIMFGLLDVAAFVVDPNGIEIWTGAPAWAAPTVLALVVLVAFFAGYAPGLILGLTALGVAFVQALLGMAAADVVTGIDAPCGDPGLGVGFAVAFVLLPVAGLSLRPGRG